MYDTRHTTGKELSREFKIRSIYKWAFGNQYFLKEFEKDWYALYEAVVRNGYYLEDLSDLMIDFIYRWGDGRF